MLADCHVHTTEKKVSPARFIDRLDCAGVDRAILLSFPPISFGHICELSEFEASLANVMEAAAYSKRVIPFLWIDPLEPDVEEQIEKAAECGIAGFKVICHRYFPGDERPMQVWRLIARTGKPILFHSGILFGRGPWSDYNRPAGFEALFEVPKLRFALAHVSWPWCDECLAVYGHWTSRKEGGTTTAEMFIDTTPGTPRIYRNEVFTKLFNIGYDVEDNLLFGTDNGASYNVSNLRTILEMDREALDLNQVSPERREKYYGKNLERFLGTLG